MPVHNNDGSLSFHATEMRDIVSGKTPYHHCVACEGSGYENWDEDGSDLKPNRSADPTRENGMCQTCGGAGIVPGVALVGKDRLRPFTPPNTLKVVVRNIVELPNKEVIDMSQILRISPLFRGTYYCVEFTNNTTQRYVERRVPRSILISLWKGETCDM